MTPFGNVPLGSVLPIFFDSYAGSTGASSTISGLAVTDVEVYKGVSMTQRSSDAGYVLLDTDGIDLDGITGINGFSIDTGDNTDAGFFAAGSFYNVVVSAITVDSQTVNFVAATFRIVAAEGTAGTPVADATRWNNLATVELPLVPTTAGRKLDVSAGGEAGIDWANVGSPTTTLNLSGTTIATTQKVDVETIKTNPVVNGGTTTFPTNATLASTTNITAGTITTTTSVTNRVTANTDQLGGQTVTASGGIAFQNGTVATTTNITAGTITTVTNLTNAPTNGDFTAVMKTSLNAATPAATLSATGSAAFTESYRANGAAGTLPQLMYEILAHLGEASISGVTKTINKLDHVTPAETFTLDSATAPTSITRAT